MNEELKPCPFCGKATSVRIERSEEILIGFPGYVVICAGGTDGPGGCGASSPWTDSPKKAAKAWNARPEPEEVAQLRAKIADCARLIARLALQLKVHAPKNGMYELVLDFLKRNDLQGDPLRMTDLAQLPEEHDER